MHRPFAAVAVLSTAAAVLALAGCGSSSSTAPSGTSFKSLSPAEQASFEQVAVSEVESDISSFTSLSPYAGLGFDRAISHRFNGGLQMGHSNALKAPKFFQNSGDCVTLSPADPVDSDNDGVVDTLTETFNCNESSGGITETISGDFAYGDPKPNTPGVDVDEGANLTLAESGSGDGDINLTLSGQASISQGSGEIDESGAWALNEVLANNPQNENGTFKLSTNETAKYVYGGANLTSFGVLPAGAFSVSGSWNYVIQTTQVNVNLSFTVSTPSALQINTETCTSNPEGISSGEVDIKFSDGTVVKAVWDQCPATPAITVT